MVMINNWAQIIISQAEMKMMVTKKIKMKMINSIEKSSSLNCSLFPKREREDQWSPSSYQRRKLQNKVQKKGGGLHFRLFVVKIESICKAMRKGCGKDNVCVPINPQTKQQGKRRLEEGY